MFLEISQDSQESAPVRESQALSFFTEHLRTILLEATISSLIDSLTTSVPYHLETSQLICNANQLTDFYMMDNIRRYWVNSQLGHKPIAIILKVH